MNEKNPSLQLELFSQQNKSEAGSNSYEKGNHLFSHIKDCEKTILLIIIFLIASVASFALGVEKGRRATERNLYVKVNRPVAAETVKTPVKVPAPIERIQTPRAQPQALLQYYTIQLGSFRNTESARKEAENLRKRGLSPLIANKGKYSVLCVGRFSSKESAATALMELKKAYKDCFLAKIGT